jgi:hypothetical protein
MTVSEGMAADHHTVPVCAGMEMGSPSKARSRQSTLSLLPPGSLVGADVE